MYGFLFTLRARDKKTPPHAHVHTSHPHSLTSTLPNVHTPSRPHSLPHFIPLLNFCPLHSQETLCVSTVVAANQRSSREKWLTFRLSRPSSLGCGPSASDARAACTRTSCAQGEAVPNAFILLGGSLPAVLQQAKHWRDQHPARPIPCPTRTLCKRRSWHTVAPGSWYGLSPGPLYGQTPVRSMIKA